MIEQQGIAMDLNLEHLILFNMAKASLMEESKQAISKRIKEEEGEDFEEEDFEEEQRDINNGNEMSGT